jgi:1,4-alpha-glucan branching enzyme
LHALDYDALGFEWIVSDDADQSVLAWIRRDQHGNEVIAVSNFTPVPRYGYQLGIAQAGSWVEVLNTDSTQYGGSGVGSGTQQVVTKKVATHGKPFSISVTVPPLATVYLVRR